MFKHKRAAFIGVAIHARLFVGFRRFYVPRTRPVGPGGLERAMRVVAIRAIHEALIHSMFEWHGELRFHVQMTAGTQCGLGFRQQLYRRGRVVNGVAVGANDVVLRVGRPADIGARERLAMTPQASVQHLLFGDLGKRNNRSGCCGAFNVIVSRTMAALAACVFRRFLARNNAFIVRVFVEAVPNVRMTPFACCAADEFVAPGCSRQNL